jgi:transposase
MARKLTSADEEAVLELLLVEGWRHQDEIIFWLWCERGVLVNRSTISRMLKRRKWTQKELCRISLGRSEDLRQGWREEMQQYVAEDLVFFDKSIFNEKTGWRYQAYGPIEQDIRYPANTQRGRTWSICAATTVQG